MPRRIRYAARVRLRFVLALVALAPPGDWWDAFVDALRGAPGRAELARVQSFAEDGLAFDVPAALRRTEKRLPSAREWSFARGGFELEVHDGEGRYSVADVLGTLADTLAGGKHVAAVGPEAGRKVTLCGREVESVRARIRVMDEWTAYEGFDLPASEGRVRWLLFQDELRDGQPSATARATYAAVLASLRCD